MYHVTVWFAFPDPLLCPLHGFELFYLETWYGCWNETLGTFIQSLRLSPLAQPGCLLGSTVKGMLAEFSICLMSLWQFPGYKSNPECQRCWSWGCLGQSSGPDMQGERLRPADFSVDPRPLWNLGGWCLLQVSVLLWRRISSFWLGPPSVSY